jgi:hypothetical protein
MGAYIACFVVPDFIRDQVSLGGHLEQGLSGTAQVRGDDSLVFVLMRSGPCVPEPSAQRVFVSQHPATALGECSCAAGRKRTNGT